MDWYFTKIYDRWIKKEFYEVHRLWVPHNLEKHVKFLRRYFRVMDRDTTPHIYKRRKSALEYAETAVMMLARLDALCDMDIPVAAGSTYLATTPWAVFGEAPETRAKLKFRDFEDIATHYYDTIVRGGSSPEYLHFRVAPSLLRQLSNKHKQTSHFIVSVALALLYDLVTRCGPDCEVIHDLFSNDLRETPDKANLDKWQDTRCKVMGRDGRVKSRPYRWIVGQIYDPVVPMVSSTKIELITDVDELSAGERCQIFKSVPRVPYCMGACDEYDDGTPALETDLAYRERVRGSASKYPQLDLWA